MAQVSSIVDIYIGHDIVSFGITIAPAHYRGSEFIHGFVLLLCSLAPSLLEKLIRKEREGTSTICSQEESIVADVLEIIVVQERSGVTVACQG
jgi:hypothetical protein